MVQRARFLKFGLISIFSILLMVVVYIAINRYYSKDTAPPYKIFQIGFNKCGTTTLAAFFKANNLNSVHHLQGELASTIYANYAAGKLLLTGIDHHHAYFDMENFLHEPQQYVAQDFFKNLDQQYPGSKFILNTRDKHAWLKSRARHIVKAHNKTYLELVAEHLNMSKQSVLAMWSAQWDAHHAAVLEHFKDRSQDLLVFDITTDSPEKIRTFFKADFNLDTALYKHVDVSTKAPLKIVKIFQIGFNKCGTTTLSDFFNNNNVPSVHYDDGKLAVSMWNNYNSNQPLIPKHYEMYTAFFDMQNIHHAPPLFISQTLFKELDKQYPGSKFILNTRDKAAWIRSRSNHNTMYGISYLELIALRNKVSKSEVIDMWSEEWDTHHAAVLEYFKDRPDDLLVFNIETDSLEKLHCFFIENYVLDMTKYVIKNKTISHN